MRRIITILFTCFTVAAFGQSAINPNPLAYTWPKLSDAINTPMDSGSIVHVGELGKDGEFSVGVISASIVPDGITVIDKGDGTALVKDMSQSESINMKQFGLTSSLIVDQSPIFRKMRDFVNNMHGKKDWKMHIPYGFYMLTDTVTYSYGFEVYGDGMYATTIMRNFWSVGHTTCGVFTWESAGLGQYITGIYVHDITIAGNGAALGHDQWGHGVALYGTDGARFDRVRFYDFRGDGLYIGAGRTANTADVRDNMNVYVNACLFDGKDCKNNRNGISIISNRGFYCTNTIFQNIGNDTLSLSVGPIDDERNSNSAWAGDFVVQNCQFLHNNSLNTSCITIFETTPAGYFDIASNFVIENNTFRDNYWDIVPNNFLDFRTTDAERCAVKIRNNHHYNAKVAIRAAGRGIWIDGDDFHGNATNFSNIQLGNVFGWKDIDVQDVWITNCLFDSAAQNGAIEMYNARFVHILNCTNVNRRPMVYLYADNANPAGAPYRSMDYIDIINPTMKGPANNDINAGSLYLINAATGFNLNNFFINSTCTIRDWHLANRVQLFGGVETYIPGATVTHEPTNGTWDAGNTLNYTPSGDDNNNRLICTMGGTFPIAGDTAINTFTAINGSNLITYTRGTNVLRSELREGHYVSLTGSSLRYKIIGTKDSSGLYVDQAYNGSTGNTTATWIAPTFRIQSLLEKYTAINSNVIVTPSNTDQFVEFNTANRVVTLGYDLTTKPGIRMSFRNSTAGDAYIYMGIGGSDTVRIDGKTDTIRLFPGEDMRIESTTANTWRYVNRSRLILERDPVTPTDVFYSKGKVSLKGTGGLYVGDNGGAGWVIDKRLSAWPSNIVSNYLIWGESGGPFNAGDAGILGRQGLRLGVGGIGTGKTALYISPATRFSFTDVAAAGGSKFDMRNSDSLAILLPNLSRAKFAALTPANAGLFAYDPTTDKLVFMGANSVVKAIPDSGSMSTTARASLSLTTTGASGAATYNNATGVLNIPVIPTTFWNRSVTTLSPLNAGDNISTTGQGAFGSIKVTDGSQGTGKVLTSDASGNGTWQTPSSGGGTNYGNNTVTVTTATATIPDVPGNKTVVLVNYSGGTATVTLPAASTNAGKEVTIKTITSNGVSITPVFSSDANTIGGSTFNAYNYYSNGTNWYMIGRN